MRAPTIMWLSRPPAEAYWRWAGTSPAPLVTVTTSVSPWPWIAVSPAAIPKFKYPAVCVAHRCPSHPYRGPLYYSLHAVGTPPAELHPALKTHLREHHGDLASLAPHSLATDPPPRYWPPRPSLGFGSTTYSVALLLQWMLAPRWRAWPWRGSHTAGQERAKLAHLVSGVGTSQEGEAMILLSYVPRLAAQSGVYWLVPDSEAAVGALRTYQEGGHCGDGIHHLYATVLAGSRVVPASAINVLTTPPH